MKKTKLHPVHPGEVLLEEFLRPMGISQNRLAFGIEVPPLICTFTIRTFFYIIQIIGGEICIQPLSGRTIIWMR